MHRDILPLTSAYSSFMLLKYKLAVAKQLCGEHIDPDNLIGKRIDSGIYKSASCIKKADLP